jgi:hypothetical protein
MKQKPSVVSHKNRIFFLLKRYSLLPFAHSNAVQVQWTRGGFWFGISLARHAARCWLTVVCSFCSSTTVTGPLPPIKETVQILGSTRLCIAGVIDCLIITPFDSGNQCHTLCVINLGNPWRISRLIFEMGSKTFKTCWSGAGIGSNAGQIPFSQLGFASVCCTAI